MQARIAALHPQLEALRRRYTNDPHRLVGETRALYQAHDINLLRPDTLIGMAVQLPVLSGLFAAVRKGLGAKVRFLWVPDLARPEGLMMLGVAAVTAWGASSTPAAPGQTTTPSTFVMIAVVGTLVFLWSASSAVALSVGAGSLVSVLQNWLLARDAREKPTAGSP